MRVAKYALASMIFFAAASPVLAQDETEDASAVVAPLQEKSKKQTAEPNLCINNYRCNIPQLNCFISCSDRN